MRKLSISGRLFLGFGCILVFLLLSSVMYITCMASIGEQTQLYDKHTIPALRSMYKMKVDMQAASQFMMKAVIEEDAAMSGKALEEVDRYAADFSEQLNAFLANQGNDKFEEELGIINEAAGIARTARAQIVELLSANNKESDEKALGIFLNEYEPALRQINEVLKSLEVMINENADAQGAAITNILQSSWNGVIFTVILSIILAIGVAFIIRKSILTPVKDIAKVYEEISKGHLSAEIKYRSNDELGNMAESIRRTNALITAYIQDISKKLGQMADGDMRVQMDMDYIGDFAAIRSSIEQLTRSLNETLRMIDTTAEQVSTGASQMSSGAQALAAGSTEQASALEQLSASVAQVAEQALENSANVKTATRIVEQAGIDVETGNEHMDSLTQAMAEINATSNQIAGITKVIEDIAFQTNILALNAAIEAARAGSAGKGFAVVADEVRNLAAKSAEAAKQTTELIEASVSTVLKGTEITSKTAEILKNIRDNTKVVIDNINKIDIGSTEQAEAIEQIKLSLNQVSAVVQTNAATAEENSAISEEMSAQANAMHDAVRRFKLGTI